jgi:hypothetical protein
MRLLHEAAQVLPMARLAIIRNRKEVKASHGTFRHTRWTRASMAVR